MSFSPPSLLCTSGVTVLLLWLIFRQPQFRGYQRQRLFGRLTKISHKIKNRKIPSTLPLVTFRYLIIKKISSYHPSIGSIDHVPFNNEKTGNYRSNPIIIIPYHKRNYLIKRYTIRNLISREKRGNYRCFWHLYTHTCPVTSGISYIKLSIFSVLWFFHLLSPGPYQMRRQPVSKIPRRAPHNHAAQNIGRVMHI